MMTVREWAARYGFDVARVPDAVLDGWRVKWNGRLKRRLGDARFREQLITINPALRAIPDQHRDTFLHEAAHAMVGRAAGHGLQWKLAARLLGARPEAREFVPEALAVMPWVAHCPRCQVNVGGRVRRPQSHRRYTHTKCRTEVVWKRNA
jgi:hypothetical protein